MIDMWCKTENNLEVMYDVFRVSLVELLGKEKRKLAYLLYYQI